MSDRLGGIGTEMIQTTTQKTGYLKTKGGGMFKKGEKRGPVKPRIPRFAAVIDAKKANAMIDSLETAPTSSGKTQLVRHLSGDMLTMGEAIKAKCCDCCGGYADGRFSCEDPACPLFNYMPHRKKIAPKEAD
jgi:hypothetical protein